MVRNRHADDPDPDQGGRLAAPGAAPDLHGVASTTAEIPPTIVVPNTPQLPFEKYTLPNGLEVILHEDHRMPRGRGRRLVQGRLEGRGRRTYRLCAPVRARDVPGDEARRRGQALRVPAEGGRLERQRIDLGRPHQLLRGRAVEPARARAVARERPHGVPARPARIPRDARQPARRREERAPPAGREPPDGPGLQDPARGALSAAAPLLPRGDRLDGGPVGRLGRRREGLLPHLLRAGQRDAHRRRRLRSPAASRSWSRSTSVRSRRR